MALAGGVSLRFRERAGYLYQEGMILSPDGHCRPFDAEARGTRAGAGAGIVVLKRLADALADRDTIHAVILGTAINNDGAGKAGFTAPSVDGQVEVDRHGAGIGRRVAAHHRLRRGARHRHAARRPDRDRGPDPACSAPPPTTSASAPRFAEGQPRPPRRRGRRGRPDQDRAGAEAPR